METPDPPKALVFPQLKSAIAASFGSFVVGSINSWSGSALTGMNQEFKMNPTEYSLTASLVSYGALLGSLLAGQAMDFLGRKKIMLSVAPLAGCGWAIIGTATSVYFVYAGRFICGLSTGILLISCSVYTSETCQSSLRGRLGSLSILNMTFGVLTSYILGGFFSWRNSALISIIPAIIFFGLLYLVPESPYWHLLHGDVKAASESLTILRGKDFPIESELKEMSLKLSEIGTNIGYSEFLNRRTLLPLAVALFIQTLQQFTGGNVIMMYTSTIFENAQSSINVEMATIYTGLAQVVGNIVSIVIIDKYGRKKLFAASAALCGICMGILGEYFFTLSSEYSWPSWGSLVITICVVFSYCLGCRSIPWIIGSELFNTSIRSRANSIIVFYNRLLNIITIQAFPYASKMFGNSSVFFVYASISLLGAIGTLLFVPETKNKSLGEIQAYFEERAVKRKVDRHNA